MKVTREGAEVRARAGYFAPGKEPRGKTRESATPTVLDKAFGAALPSGTSPLEAGAAPFAAPGNQAIVVVTAVVRRPVSGSVAVENLEVRTAAFDADSLKERTSERQTAESRTSRRFACRCPGSCWACGEAIRTTGSRTATCGSGWTELTPRFRFGNGD